MYEEMKRLYVEEKYTLRRIAEQYHTNHHFVKRRLQEMGVEITREGRKMEPFSDEHKHKLSIAKKGKPAPWSRRRHTTEELYRNMYTHLLWDVEEDFLKQFKDIEKLKFLNRLISRDRVRVHFNTDTYKAFIEKFYYDESFNRQYEIYQATKNHYDIPTIDHIIPLSRGGNWDFDNLRIISWFENKAKSDLLVDEFTEKVKQYFSYIIEQ